MGLYSATAITLRIYWGLPLIRHKNYSGINSQRYSRKRREWLGLSRGEGRVKVELGQGSCHGPWATRCLQLSLSLPLFPVCSFRIPGRSSVRSRGSAGLGASPGTSTQTGRADNGRMTVMMKIMMMIHISELGKYAGERLSILTNALWVVPWQS